MNITPHIAPRQNSRTIDGRTTRHWTYQISRRKRKRVEEIFGWAKTVGVIRKAKMRGRKKIDWLFTMNIAVFNLVRMRDIGANIELAFETNLLKRLGLYLDPDMRNLPNVTEINANPYGLPYEINDEVLGISGTPMQGYYNSDSGTHTRIIIINEGVTLSYTGSAPRDSREQTCSSSTVRMRNIS